MQMLNIINASNVLNRGVVERPIIVCNVTKLLNSIQLLLYIELPEVMWRNVCQNVGSTCHYIRVIIKVHCN